MDVATLRRVRRASVAAIMIVGCARSSDPSPIAVDSLIDVAADVADARTYSAADFAGYEYDFYGLPPVAGKFTLTRDCVLTANGIFNFHHWAARNGTVVVPEVECTSFKSLVISKLATFGPRDAGSCPDDYPSAKVVLMDGTTIKTGERCSNEEPFVTLAPAMVKLTELIPAAADAGSD